jgi:hypothetical protein
LTHFQQVLFLALRQALLKLGTVAGIVVLSVCATRAFGPRPTVAQPAQQGDIRATSFTLVGADGTVLGRLAAGPAGNGNLTVYDTAGRMRAGVAGGGNVTVFDPDGKARAVLAHDAAGPFAGFGGLVALDANGNFRAVAGYSATNESPFLALFDETLPPTSGCGGLGPRSCRFSACPM